MICKFTVPMLLSLVLVMASNATAEDPIELTPIDRQPFSDPANPDHESFLYFKHFDGKREIVGLYLIGDKVDDQYLKQIKDLPKLQDLMLVRTRVTSKGLKEIVRFKKSLRRVTLVATALNDECMHVLSELSQLENLEIIGLPAIAGGSQRVRDRAAYGKEYEGLTDKGIAALCQIKSLKRLTLEGIPVTSEGLKNVDKLGRLHELKLGFTLVDDQVLQSLTQNRALLSLFLRGTRISGRGFKAASLPTVAVLDLGGTDVSDETFPFLSTLKNLRLVVLDDTKVGTRGIDALHKKHPFVRIKTEYGPPRLLDMQRKGAARPDYCISVYLLRTFDMPMEYTNGRVHAVALNGMKRVSALLKRISRLQDVERVFAEDCGWGDREMRVLAGLSHLKVLRLAGNELTDAGVSSLSQLRNLEQLDLSRTRVTNEALTSIAKLKNLRMLFLSETSLDDANLDVIARLPHLGVLTLNNGTRISDTGVGALAESRSLTVLTVSGPLITNRAVVELAKMKQLTLLMLRDTNIDDESVDYLLQLKKLETLDISGGNITESGVQRIRRAFGKSLMLCWSNES